jgi:hypothetical protein
MVQPHNTANFAVYAVNLQDAGTSQDAGSQEADALELTLDQQVTGHLYANGDIADYYILDNTKANTTYEIKVRPSVNLQAKITVVDQDGKTLRNASSGDKGSLATARVKTNDEGYLLISIEEGSFDRGSPFSYSLVASEGKAKSPRQPRVPTVVSLPNMRQ